MTGGATGAPALLALLLLACGAPSERRQPVPGPAPSPSPSRVDTPAETRPTATATASRPGTGSQSAPAGWLDAAVLEPDPMATNGELERVRGWVLRKHDVYDRLLELDAPRAVEVRELLCLDLLVAAEVRAHGIQVARAEVEAAVDDEFGKLRRRFDAELASRMTFPVFLSREFGLDEAGYRQWLWRRAARALLRERAIRFWSWRRDRVTCRFLRVTDRALAEELRGKIAAGADLGILARKHSEDDTRDLGGLLPEFPLDFDHPVARIARALAAGELSPVMADTGPPAGVYLVQCLARRQARREPWVVLAGDVLQDLKRQPVSAFESTAFYLERRGAENPLEGSATRR